MTCHHCAEAVRKALQKLPGVQAVIVDLPSNTATLTLVPAHDRHQDESHAHDAGAATPQVCADTLRQALQQAGYDLAG